MIVRDLSPIPYRGGKLSPGERLRGLMKFGLGWPTKMKSQETIIRVFIRLLDNAYTLLRNVSLPGESGIVPLILIGPQGVFILVNDPIRGIFRARGDVWSVHRTRDGSFRPSKPNMITETIKAARKVEGFLRARGYNEVPVEGMLVLTNPGTHVNTIRPAVRVLMVDGLDRFAIQLAEADPVLTREQRYKIVEALTDASSEKDEAPAPKKRSLPGAEVAHDIDIRFNQALTPVKQRTNFTTRQWLILGGIVLVEVCILTAFLLLVFMTA